MYIQTHHNGTTTMKNKLPENLKNMLLSQLVYINDQFDRCKKLSPKNNELDNIFNSIEDNEALTESAEDYVSLMGERSIQQMFKLKEKIESLQNFMQENNISFQHDKERALNFEKTYTNTQ